MGFKALPVSRESPVVAGVVSCAVVSINGNLFRVDSPIRVISSNILESPLSILSADEPKFKEDV